MPLWRPQGYLDRLFRDAFNAARLVTQSSGAGVASTRSKLNPSASVCVYLMLTGFRLIAFVLREALSPLDCRRLRPKEPTRDCHGRVLGAHFGIAARLSRWRRARGGANT